MDRTILERMFSDKNHTLSGQIVQLLENEPAIDIFAVLAFVSTYAIIRADEEKVASRTEIKDKFVGLIDIFLKASGDADAKRDQSTPSTILQ